MSSSEDAALAARSHERRGSGQLTDAEVHEVYNEGSPTSSRSRASAMHRISQRVAKDPSRCHCRLCRSRS